MAIKHELRSLLEQSCQMADELMGNAVKLVVDVQAVHYWTTHALETGRQLKNIGTNLRSLLTACEPLISEPAKLHEDETGKKFMRTVFGLWRALPGLNSKYTEQLSRRRRQRIMGVEPEDVGEVPEEQIEQEAAELRQLREQLGLLFGELKILAGKLPEELVVEVGAQGAQGGEGSGKPAAEDDTPAAQEPATSQPAPEPPDQAAQASTPAELPSEPPLAAKPLDEDEVLPI